MKKLIWFSTLSLAIAATSLPAVAQRQQIQYNLNAPRISSTSGYANTHYIKLYTGEQPLSYITVRPSELLTVGNRIDVKDQSGQKIPTNISRENDQIRIDFSQPVPPRSTLEIAFRDVALNTPTPRSTFYYEISGGHIGFRRAIPYGLAQVQVY